MEISFNEIYAIFARMYYGEDAISSVYVWEQGDSYENGFNLALLINNGTRLSKKSSVGLISKPFNKSALIFLTKKKFLILF